MPNITLLCKSVLEVTISMGATAREKPGKFVFRITKWINAVYIQQLQITRIVDTYYINSITQSQAHHVEYHKCNQNYVRVHI